MSELMNNIKNLREITGAGFLDCKKALEENSNEIESSIDFLRKKGLAKANKKSSREAKEGAIGIYSNDKYSTIIQINTETDFAAKNDVFLNFMDLIGNFSLQQNPIDLSLETFKEILLDEVSVNDHFKNIIAKIGENIVFSKLVVVNNPDKNLLSSYIHNPYRKNIGKIAVVLKSKVEIDNDEAKVLGKNLCMHIAASKPLAMNIDNLDIDLVKKEKEVQLDLIKSSGKPQNILDKILEGKMKKFYSETTFLHQQYILDPDKSIEEIISEFSKNNKFNVEMYNLLVLGN